MGNDKYVVESKMNLDYSSDTFSSFFSLFPSDAALHREQFFHVSSQTKQSFTAKPCSSLSPVSHPPELNSPSSSVHLPAEFKLES